MIPAPCTNRLIRGGWCVGSQPAILVGAWIARSVAEWSVRTARIDRHPCVRSPHAPRTRNPEPRVRENRKTESRDFDSGTGCRKTPSRAGGQLPTRGGASEVGSISFGTSMYTLRCINLHYEVYNQLYLVSTLC
jgi:hypothetical protein